ncbi:MAG TPA: type IV pilin protein [Telluria sp.]
MNQGIMSRQPAASAGFTLVEMMITIVIVAILSALALPAYNDYITRSRIPQATSNLSAMRVRLEQFYMDNRTYVGACTAALLPPADDFTYACPTLTATAYTVTATGGAKMTNFTYSIDHLNARKTTNLPDTKWGTAPVNCWVIRKGGGC